MPKKFTGENTRVTKANEKKAVVQAEKDIKKSKEKQAKEEAEWAVGAKSNSKKEEEERKKQEAQKKKAEAARLLQEETEAFSKKAPILKVRGEEKKALKKTQTVDAASKLQEQLTEFTATNIEDAIDLLSITNDSTAISGSKTAKDIDRHPERRFKAALAAYEERELPKVKQDFPGLRLNQYKEMIYKNFQKSPDNPFNQNNVVEYNAEKKDEAELVETRRKEIESRLQT